MNVKSIECKVSKRVNIFLNTRCELETVCVSTYWQLHNLYQTMSHILFLPLFANSLTGASLELPANNN